MFASTVRNRFIKSGVQFKEIGSTLLDHTAFFYVDSLPATFKTRLETWYWDGTKPWVNCYYYLEYEQAKKQKLEDDRQKRKNLAKRDRAWIDPDADNNSTARLEKRDSAVGSDWAGSQISTPPLADWFNDHRFRQGEDDFKRWFHPSQGAGQFIYALDSGIWTDHQVSEATNRVVESGARHRAVGARLTGIQEFTGAAIERMLEGGRYGLATESIDGKHGSYVAAQAIGQKLGTAKKATFRMIQHGLEEKLTDRCYEKFIEGVLLAADDIKRQGRVGKAVLNLSLGWTLNICPEYVIQGLCKSSP